MNVFHLAPCRVPRSVRALLSLLTVCALAAGLGLAPQGADDVVRGADRPLVVFLVRHAEKESTGGHDPALTARGVARSAALASALRDSGIVHVHSSDYERTRATARPLAEALGLELELYDPRDLARLVERLRAAGGRHLVVGHSNTTPAVVELLGGVPGTAIVEATEYDRLYVVTQTSTVLLRYGD